MQNWIFFSSIFKSRLKIRQSLLFLSSIEINFPFFPLLSLRSGKLNPRKWINEITEKTKWLMKLSSNMLSSEKSESLDVSVCWTYGGWEWSKKFSYSKAKQRSQFPTSSFSAFYIASAHSSRFSLWSCIILPSGHQ